MIYVFATFTKTGNLKYISHLDLHRAMTRLLLRSGLPIRFSEGFNPHPKLTFAQPLSLFQESLCEVAEFRLNEGADCPDEAGALEKLRAVEPEGMHFVQVAYSERKLPVCKAATYELTFRTSLAVDAFAALFDGEMPVVKKTKTKEKTLDIAPLIGEKRFSACEGGVKLRCVLPCGNDYLNPSYVETFLGDRITGMQVLRTELHF